MLLLLEEKLMDVIEAANILPKDDPERKRLLSIVVCGGGQTVLKLLVKFKIILTKI